MSRTSPAGFALATFLIAGAVPAGPAIAGERLRPGPFHSLTARNGAHVVLRHGATPGVTLLEGSLEHTSVIVRDGRLRIDRCPGDCPRGYRVLVEVTAPDIGEIAVEDGGSVEALEGFPGAARLSVAVRDGGTVDVRALPAETVSAAVRSGGRIFTRPGGALAATIAEGGIVTYWGRARVTSSIRHGGAVTRGEAADADRPLHELGPDLPAVPPVPSLPRAGGRRIP